MRFLFLMSILVLQTMTANARLSIEEQNRLGTSINCRVEMIKAAQKYVEERLKISGVEFDQEKMNEYIRSMQATLGNASGDLCVGMLEAAKASK